MTKTSYRSCAMKPEEIVSCTALDASDYPERYAEKADKIVADIADDSLKARVKQTLGYFEKGSAGNLVQSNPYRLVVLQSLLPEGKFLASRPRLQIAKENDSNFMSGFYVDCGLNLVTYQGNEKMNPINHILAERLGEDLRSMGIDTRESRLIPYHILTLQVGGESPSGLFFKLSREGEDRVKQAVLNTQDFRWDYIPSPNGLFGVFLYGDGVWNCGGWSLGGSCRSGGVVVESAQGTSQNFDEYNSRIEKERAKLEDRLNRIRRAEAILKGK